MGGGGLEGRREGETGREREREGRKEEKESLFTRVIVKRVCFFYTVSHRDRQTGTETERETDRARQTETESNTEGDRCTKMNVY